MSKWIFQDIEDLRAEMHREATANDGGVIGKPLRNFHAKLREQIDPELFTQYQIWRCDIYVDVAQIIYDVCEVYDVTKKQVFAWIVKHKAEHHELDVPNLWLRKVGEYKYEICIPD